MTLLWLNWQRLQAKENFNQALELDKKDQAAKDGLKLISRLQSHLEAGGHHKCLCVGTFYLPTTRAFLTHAGVQVSPSIDLTTTFEAC